MQIAQNAFVIVDYRLEDAAGKVLESSESGSPILYVHGYSMLVPGLEAGLVGLSAGDAKRIEVAPEQAFGEHDPERVFSVDRAALPDTTGIEPGDFLVAEDEDGDETDLQVLEIHPDHVLVDANHVLAGKTLVFHVVVREVRAATADEVEAAANSFTRIQTQQAEARNPEVDEAVKQAMAELSDKRSLPN